MTHLTATGEGLVCEECQKEFNTAGMASDQSVHDHLTINHNIEWREANIIIESAYHQQDVQDLHEHQEDSTTQTFWVAVRVNKGLFHQEYVDWQTMRITRSECKTECQWNKDARPEWHDMHPVARIVRCTVNVHTELHRFVDVK